MNPAGLRRTSTVFAHVETWLTVIGLILLVAGLQAVVFDRQVAGATAGVPQALVELERERNDNNRMNDALHALQLYRRASRDEKARRGVLLVRDAVLERYNQDRRAAMEALLEASDSLSAQTPAEEGALAEFRAKSRAVSELYENRTGKALERYLSPPWYLQPTASFLNDDARQLHGLRFNHALYLMHSGDTAAALELLAGMRDSSDARNADVDFAMARLSFETWVAEPDPVLFAESLERATRSVREDARNSQAKLFLEYLLSLDHSAEKVDLEPEEGQGDGEGQGERGVVSTERGEF